MSRPGRARCLVLVGYRATGKSTVGRLLADRLGMGFLDTDALIEGRAGMSIAAMFSSRGEPVFRDLEADVIAALAEGLAAPVILATGGGAILRAENRAALKALGYVAWLQADPETIAARLAADPAGRPALTPLGLSGEVRSVLRERMASYEAAAHAAFQVDRLTADQVAGEVADHYRRWCGQVGESSE